MAPGLEAMRPPERADRELDADKSSGIMFASQTPQLSLLCLQAQSSGRDLKLGGDGTDSENQPLSLIYDPQP